MPAVLVRPPTSPLHDHRFDHEALERRVFDALRVWMRTTGGAFAGPDLHFERQALWRAFHLEHLRPPWNAAYVRPTRDPRPLPERAEAWKRAAREVRARRERDDG